MKEGESSGNIHPCGEGLTAKWRSDCFTLNASEGGGIAGTLGNGHLSSSVEAAFEEDKSGDKIWAGMNKWFRKRDLGSRCVQETEHTGDGGTEGDSVSTLRVSRGKLKLGGT